MVGATKIRNDENEANNYTKVKNFGLTNTTEVTKRAALGDLQNRAVLRHAAAKDAAQKDVDAKLKNVIQNTKSRVDTHWKKAPGAVAASIKPNATAAAEQPKKNVTRSNSLRGPNGVVPSALQRNVVSGLNKPKTLTVKVVENKLQQAKLSKTKVTEEAKTKKSVTVGEHLALRREDSNLSRKSLTKLKAALSRDSGSKVIAAKATAQSIKGKQEPLAAKEPRDSGSEISKQSSLKIKSVQTLSPEGIEGVEDIDSGDSDQLLLVSEYVNDIYNYLFQLEEEQYIRKNHLDCQDEVHPKMRAVLIDWINEVHCQFHLDPETFQMAVAIIDRYLQEVKDTKRIHLQLVGVTALFIAAKYEELIPPSISEFVFITDDTYNSKQIVQMELKIFKTLDCNLARPLPIHFLRRFSKAAKVEDIHHAMAKYFIELTSIEYDLAAYKPSEIAASSLFLALHLLKDNAKLPTGFNNKHWTPTMQWYSHYSAEHLRPIAKKIAAVVRNAPAAKLKSVYTKYQKSKFYKISLRSELYDKLIDSIINHAE
ncbi:G2/mitotic-specific cyclin-B [Rhagoletis pomonella]|uniref:G2/mitotic-specific cyclin-B n=1 Tax=Rhagoletis pomonella TaxID=28610 RepID=UPI00177D7469|nr:G2/mitotic-specific cyclin-B [Rhagoletis pomonella]